MTDEELKALVARLRDGVYYYNHQTRSTENFISKSERLAADAIEALMAERDDVVLANRNNMDWYNAAIARAERAEAVVRKFVAYQVKKEGLIVGPTMWIDLLNEAEYVLAQIEKETGRE